MLYVHIEDCGCWYIYSSMGFKCTFVVLVLYSRKFSPISPCESSSKNNWNYQQAKSNQQKLS